MKQKYYLLLFLAITVSLSACGAKTRKKLIQGTDGVKPSEVKPAVSTEDIRLVQAINAFKIQGYDPNKPENKALAESLWGAEMKLSLSSDNSKDSMGPHGTLDDEQGHQKGQSVNQDPIPKLATVSVLFGPACELASKQMYGNENSANGSKGKPAKVLSLINKRSSYLPDYVEIENKCIGLGGGCELVSVLVSKRDSNGGKPAQVVIAFELDPAGQYGLVGWPTAKKEGFKSIDEALKISKCSENPEGSNP